MRWGVPVERYRPYWASCWWCYLCYRTIGVVGVDATLDEIENFWWCYLCCRTIGVVGVDATLDEIKNFWWCYLCYRTIGVVDVKRCYTRWDREFLAQLAKASWAIGMMRRACVRKLLALKNISSKTTEPIWTKFGRNVPWMVLFKSYVF